MALQSQHRLICVLHPAIHQNQMLNLGIIISLLNDYLTLFKYLFFIRTISKVSLVVIGLN